MAKNNKVDEKLNWKNTALDVMLREACVCKCDAPAYPIAPIRLGMTTAHASRVAHLVCGVLIGEGGTWAL